MTPESKAYLPHLNALIVSIFLQHKRNFGCTGREPNDKSPAFVSIVITGNWEQFSIQNHSFNAKQKLEEDTYKPPDTSLAILPVELKEKAFQCANFILKRRQKNII